MKKEIQTALEKPFPPDKVKTKPGRGRDGGRLSYISHGLITERLTDADPAWSSERIATHTYTGADGLLHCAGVEIALTVGGVTRVESGGPQRQDGFANEIKNSYSDALKRGAMRFGVALANWESLIDAEGDEDYDAPSSEMAEQIVVQSAGGAREPQANQPTPIRDPEQRLANDVRARRRESPEQPAPATWKTFWEFARSVGVKTVAQFTELTARDLPEVPEHALNLLNKTLRERDAALARATP